jgi:predicted nucleotide-binding protein (sugar kinase/HSP70/actin superfamily)
VTEHAALLHAETRRVLSELEGTKDFAVVLAGRPYHTDPLVNHGLASQFTRLGIPVLIHEAIPDIDKVDLSGVRADAVNTFHARMYATALYGARHPNLEVVQMVSFGCGHDAVITDEMTRILSETADKSLLVIKLDEGEIRGPMALRVKSFVETVRARRSRQGGTPESRPLREAFKTKFRPEDKGEKTILIPNLSEAFCRMATAAVRSEGYVAEPLPLASPRALALGKKYVHNDICFPAQVNVGEFLAAMEEGRDPDKVVCGLAKNCDDCRAGQYSVVARKALDDAGYAEVPIFTTSSVPNELHPGIKVGLKFQIRMLWGIAMTDVLEQMRLRIRPYEKVAGSVDAAFNRAVENLGRALEQGTRAALAAFGPAVRELDSVEVVEARRRPRVFVIGEILLNYHPTSNWNIVRWLEANGIEVMLPRIVDFFQRDLVRASEESRRRLVAHPILNGLVADVTDRIYTNVVSKILEVARGLRHFEEPATVRHLADNVGGIVDKSYSIGEGWLIPAEIIEHAREGVESFVVVQPFGCLPNHITGRGLTKTLKRLFPRITILSLDYDPDTSFANVENRLQMLVISARERARRDELAGFAPA